MNDQITKLEECSESMRALASVIRQHGTCAPSALESVAAKADAAIALMRGQSWQPIETAPKHQYVLVACNGVTTVARFWPTEAGVHETHPMWEDLGCYELEVQPTHWQPLPAPPKDTADEQ